MKELIIILIYLILIIIIGGFNIYGKLSDGIATLLFVTIFIIPFGVKLLYLPIKKQE
jgi:hypothetical protein